MYDERLPSSGDGIDLLSQLIELQTRLSTLQQKIEHQVPNQDMESQLSALQQQMDALRLGAVIAGAGLAALFLLGVGVFCFCRSRQTSDETLIKSRGAHNSDDANTSLELTYKDTEVEAAQVTP